MQAIIVALSSSAVAFAVLYLLLTRRVRKLVDPEAIMGQIRREVEELIAELNHTTERNITLMEEKVKAIAGTLEASEKRIAVLRREAATLEQRERVYAALRSPPEPSAPRADEATRPELAEQETGGGDVRSRIVSLHRAGISPDSISRRVNVPRAKVELIVALEEEGEA
jgi:hypothetical protein